ncbi:rhythmically expressed gene 5 protein [Agrilus planipennis]|uniref:Rhythmically expressed gene 5 protein n=1 Tax=Agrilus planipennis TaxID=224129 RepID=A0A1W4WXC3_AGRPL|nr:rhythmically expressed gene 5 protein [Agrilus planipennis]
MRCLYLISSVCAVFSVVAPSAIPMWEFLKREEKTSYIYSLFASEIEDYCQNVLEDKNCSQDLLKVGLENLKRISDEELDELDPYQRDAAYLIWDTLLGGHIAKKNPKQKTTSTPKPNSYEDDLLLEVTNDEFGTQEEESAKIESYYTVEPPKGFVFVPFTDKLIFDTSSPDQDQAFTESVHISNNIPDNKYIENKKKKPTALKKQDLKSTIPFEVLFTKKMDNQGPLEDLEYSRDYPKVYLTGPSVVRVYPDGSPVTDFTPQIPQDEDLYQYKMQHMKIPRF